MCASSSVAEQLASVGMDRLSLDRSGDSTIRITSQ